MEPRAEI